MLELEETHPHVYNGFCQGLHVIRRTDRLWAGLSSDFIIEQCLMRSMKTSGGLTRGRGINQLQRDVWCLSMPATASISQAMQEFTSVRYTGSEQHKEASNTRIEQDRKDTEAILNYLVDRNPFQANASNTLHSISSGMEAGDKVNVDKAKEVGQVIVNYDRPRLIQLYIQTKYASSNHAKPRSYDR